MYFILKTDYFHIKGVFLLKYQPISIFPSTGSAAALLAHARNLANSSKHPEALNEIDESSSSLWAI